MQCPLIAAVMLHGHCRSLDSLLTLEWTPAGFNDDRRGLIPPNQSNFSCDSTHNSDDDKFEAALDYI